MLNNGYVFQAIRPIIVLAVLFECTYFLCNFGQKLTNEFENISDSVYKMHWHLMPIEVRKKLPTIMAVAQRPVYIKGFARIQGTHEFYESVNFTFRI